MSSLCFEFASESYSSIEDVEIDENNEEEDNGWGDEDEEEGE